MNRLMYLVQFHGNNRTESYNFTGLYDQGHFYVRYDKSNFGDQSSATEYEDEIDLLDTIGEDVTPFRLELFYE